MKVSKVCVVGCGTMGNGIAQVFAVNGAQVTLVDVKQDFLDRAVKFITKSLDKFVEKGKVEKDVRDKALSLIATTTNLDDAKGAELVIEAVSEDLGIKLENIDLPDLGRAKKVKIDKENTTIVEGAGKTDAIQGRINQIKNQIEQSDSSYDKEKLQERLAK